MAKKKSKKAPSGGSISRSGNVFSFSWKKGGDYWTDQQAQYSINGSKWISFSKVGKNTTSKSFSVDFSKYNPFTKTVLSSVKCRVRGSNGSKESSWHEKTFSFFEPDKPSLTATLDSDLDNKTSFEWSASEPSEGGKHFARCEWMTVLETEGAYPNWPWRNTAHTYANGGYYTPEDNSINDGYSHTRWVAVRARGCGGNSPWVNTYHVYAKPNQSYNIRATVDISNGYLCKVDYSTSATGSRPIDFIEVQYCITKPDRGLECPSGLSWSVGSKVAFRDGSDRAQFYVDDTLSDDECMFVRVNTHHDHENNANLGVPVLADVGQLARPSHIEINPDRTHFTVAVSADNESDIVDSFLAIVYMPSSRTEDAYVVGVLPHNSTITTVTCPDWSQEDGFSIGVYAVVGTYEKSTGEDGLPRYNIKAHEGKPLMVSETEWWESGSVPSAPYNVTITDTDVVGKVRISWSNDWEEATGTELTWSDDKDSWESIDEPEDYEVKNPMATSWIITGLKSGKWYFRVRTFNENGESTTYSPYSNPVPFVVSSVPITPVLSVGNNSAVTVGSDVPVSWSFIVVDDESQQSAEVFEVIDPLHREQEYILSPDTEVKTLTIYYERSGTGTEQDPYIYTQVENPTGSPLSHGYYQKNFRSLLSAETEQHGVIDTKTAEWGAGETHYLIVRIDYSDSNTASSWSNPVSVTVAPILTCEITDTSLQNVIVPLDDDDETTQVVYSLTELPLEVTVSGTGAGIYTDVVVERAESYFARRPDESEFHGYEGETVCMVRNYTGTMPISFGLADLQMNFDDGAQYRIIAYNRDSYGQVAESVPVVFSVHWTHQAIMPEATVRIDNDTNAAIITIPAPTGALDTDRCDIYRLSADSPELIYQDATFSNTESESYVDPYPALGGNGGHRVVFKTANGDYITQDNDFAWIDLDEEDGDIINLDRTIIDFDGEQIILNYNIDLSNKWEKDFAETRYLGGSVRGDWNPAIGRNGTVTATLITLIDQDTIDAMRRLSNYAGGCHIRTQDGSSFTADIQVEEKRAHDTKRQIVDFNMTITRVDPEGLDGVTYQEFFTR